MFSGSKPPVILQVLPSLVTGGVERGTLEIVAAIVAAGGTALVASSGGRLVDAVTRAGGCHLTLPLATKSPVGIWRNAGQLESIIRDRGADLVHARSRAPAWSAWLACRRAAVPFITTYHGTYADGVPFKRLYNSVMVRGEVVIAASAFIADLIQAQHGVPADRIRLIPRGVDPAEFDPAAVASERVADVVRGWDLPDAAFAVVLPGRLTSWKGHGVLLRALARLERPDVYAVLLGAHQGRVGYVRELEALARDLGIAANVRFPGPTDDMPAALKRADVVVHASVKAEAFGRVVIEAQAMGRPVIASDLGGPVETVRQGETGWRVQPDDPDALAAAIGAVLDMSEAERVALGERARMSVPTVQAMQAATLGVYQEVLSGWKGRLGRGAIMA